MDKRKSKMWLWQPKVIYSSSQNDMEDMTEFLSSEQKYRCDVKDVQYSTETGKIKLLKFRKVTGS